MKVGMLHWGLLPVIGCSNDNPRLNFPTLQQGQIFQLGCLIWENVTMIDSLEFIAAYDLEIS